MKKIKNTLYVLTENAYLTLERENVVVKEGKAEIGRVPFHNLESIVCFSYGGASPALMGACNERNIALSFLSPRGKFRARIQGLQNGNVLLRRAQYRYADNEAEAIKIVRGFLMGKVYNCRGVLERTIRDHALRVDVEKVKNTSVKLKSSLLAINECDNLSSLRGIEGSAATIYFSVFNELLLRDKDVFVFRERTRRPPTDAVNALLSFFYTLLTLDCASALESVGLDSYVGFLHTDRPGRKSLSLDLMEELRPVFVDRFVVTLINNRIVKPTSFSTLETGEVRLNNSGKKAVLSAWQKRKLEEIKHPYLKERMQWGLVPHIQALLLVRYLRGELDSYPPFFWK